MRERQTSEQKRGLFSFLLPLSSSLFSPLSFFGKRREFVRALSSFVRSLSLELAGSFFSLCSRESKARARRATREKTPLRLTLLSLFRESRLFFLFSLPSIECARRTSAPVSSAKSPSPPKVKVRQHLLASDTHRMPEKRAEEERRGGRRNRSAPDNDDDERFQQSSFFLFLPLDLVFFLLPLFCLTRPSLPLSH